MMNSDAQKQDGGAVASTELLGDSPKPWAYDLWKHMSDEHGLTLLESELHDIILHCRKLDGEKAERLERQYWGERHVGFQLYSGRRIFVRVWTDCGEDILTPLSLQQIETERMREKLLKLAEAHLQMSCNANQLAEEALKSARVPSPNTEAVRPPEQPKSNER